MKFIFTQQAQDEFFQCDKAVQSMIRKKLEKIKQGGGYTIKPLINMLPATHRIRIGEYRLLVRSCPEGYEVLAIGHRSNIYQ